MGDVKSGETDLSGSSVKTHRDFGPVFPIETSAGIHNAWRELYYAMALALGFSAFCSVPCFMRQPAASFQFKEFPDVDVFD